MKINEDNPSKFNLWVYEVIFLGYSTTKKAYKCYGRILGRVIECIDIKVDENVQDSTRTSRQVGLNEIEDDASECENN